MEFGKAILPRETNNFFTRPLNFDRNKLIQWDFMGLKSVQFCRFLGLKSVQFCIFLPNFVVLNQILFDLGKDKTVKNKKKLRVSIRDQALSNLKY